MDEKIPHPGLQSGKLDRSSKKKRVEEIGCTLAQIRARHKASRSACPKKEDESQKSSIKISQDKSEKSEFYMLLEEDMAKAVKLEKERPKIKEELEKLKIDREQQKIVEKKIEETRAKQAAPLPEISPEIQKRISSMEMTIHSLRESLGEKDKVLSSKTESLKMLNEQLLHRSSEFAEKAELMRKEVATLKQEYTRQEEILKTEMSEYKTQLVQTELRLSQKDAECKELESAINELKETHSHCESNLQEAKQNLESVSKLSLKMKAQLKALRNENNNLKKEALSCETIETLQNRIALLEEEKEIAASAEKKIQELEDTLKDKNNLLATLSEEKSSILGDFENAKQRISQQESLISELQESINEIEQLKIAAEMKSVELEEKLDAELRDENHLVADKLEEDIHILKNTLAQQELLIKSLNVKLSEKEKEMNDAATRENEVNYEQLVHELDDWKLKFSEAENEMSSIQEQNEGLSIRVQELQLANEEFMRNSEKIVDELKKKEELLSQYKEKNEEFVVVISENSAKISSLEEEVTKLKGEEIKIRKQVQVSTESSTPSEQQDKTQKVKLLAKNLKLRAKMCHELESKLAEMNEKVIKAEEINDTLNMDKDKLTAKVNELEQQLNSLETSLNEKSQAVISLERTMDILNGSLEEKEQKYSESLQEVQIYKSEIELLKQEMTDSKEMAFLKQKDEIASYSERITFLEMELEKLQGILSEKENEIGQLRSEEIRLKEMVTKSEYELTHLQTIFVEESQKNEAVLANIKHLESELNDSQRQVYELIEQLSDLNKEFERSTDNLKERDNYIRNLEDDIEGMRSKVELLELGLEERNKIMEEKVTTLGNKLKQAEMLNDDAVKSQNEFVTTLKSCADKEEILKQNIEELKMQVDTLKQSNQELIENNSMLEQSKQSSNLKIKELEAELEALQDIRNAYNSTLDQIEVLNKDLKQVMAEIESRNQELISITEERKALIDKVKELENSYTEIHTQLCDSEMQTHTLQVELEIKKQNLKQANQDIISLQVDVSTLENYMVQICKMEAEISRLKTYYEEQIHNLQQERDDLLRVLKKEVSSQVNDVMSAAEEKVCKIHEEKAVGVFQWQEATCKDPFFDEVKDEEDGWGWIAPEVKGLDNATAESSKLQELSKKINELEEEKKCLTEDLKLSQKKCTALIRKAKEMKNRNEILEKSKSEKSTTGFEDLDFALQEEMRNQIDKSEQKNKELSAELNLLKTEKERLLKRIDTLVSANEQLIDMKERQDIEVQMWQKRSNELKNQVQGLEWNLEELRNIECANNVMELEEKLSALVSENEELQKIICDLKDGKLNASNQLESELKAVQEELRAMKECDDTFRHPEITQSEKADLEKNLNSIKEELECTRQEKDILSKTNEEMSAIFYQLNLDKDNLQTSLNAMVDECEFYKSRIQSLEENNSLTNSRVEEISKEKLDAVEQLKVILKENEQLQSAIIALKSENQNLNHVIDGLSRDNNELKNLSSTYNEELDHTVRVIRELKSTIDQLNRKLADSEEEIAALKNKNVIEDEHITAVNINPQESSPPVFRGFSFGNSEPEIDILDIATENLKMTLQQKEKELNLKQEEVKTLSEEKVRLMDEYALNLEAEKNAHAVKVNGLLSQYQAKEQEVVALRERLDNVSKELLNLREVVQETNGERNITSQQNEAITLKLQEVEKESLHWKEEASKLSAKIATLTEGFENKFADTQSAELALKDNFNILLKQKEDEYINALMLKEDEIMQYKQLIMSKEQEHQTLQNLIQKLKGEAQDLSEKFEKVSQENSCFASNTEYLSSEINKLRNENIESLSKKDAEYTYVLQKSDYQDKTICALQSDFNELRSHVESVERECSELKTLVMEKSQEIDQLQGNLRGVEEEKMKLNCDIHEKNLLLDEYKFRVKWYEEEVIKRDNELAVLPTLKAEQAQLIESLEYNIEEKNKEISRLQFLLQDTQEKLIQSQEAKMTDEVAGLKKSLDDSLYTLHLRDVRCDELTLEIMQLLEERDTLQLRLSETLRLIERLKQIEPSTVTPTVLLSEQTSTQNDETSSQSSLATCSTINDKIGELHSAYNRDPVFQNDRETRHSQQMQLYTQKNSSREEDLNTSGDYGLLNWFFGSSSTTPPSPRPTRTT